MNVFERDEFFAKAREAGMVEEVDRKVEERRREQRLAVIAKIKALPTEAETELPALGEACTAAYKALELAEEALKAADRDYKHLSQRLYGAQNKFEGDRLRLERQAQALVSVVARDAYEDFGHLESMVRDRASFDIDLAKDWFTGESRTTVTNNWEAIAACRANIKAGLDRIMEMQLETADAEESDSEIFALVGALEAEAFALGVDQKKWAERRTPHSAVDKAEDAAGKRAIQRKKQISSFAGR